MALALAETGGEPDSKALKPLREKVIAGVLADTPPTEIWPELVRGLMSGSPSKMFRILRQCGALSRILPEVAALFGVPQISEGQADVDLGEHLLEALAEASRREAPLSVRFALLVMNVGKADSPREHLPVHYQHIERGRPRIEALCERFGVGAECRNLALLAIAECERVHRVTKTRAGPIAAMVERLGAFSTPERFGQLMTVCACDFCAYEGHSGQAYPKAALLEIALQACTEIGKTGTVEAGPSARAEAIARAFRSERWSNETT
jgi:tRNA nucleotidyltransferase (CCA-adding enzyme)